MISLKHFSSCPSVVKQPKNTNGSMPFCTDNRKYKHPSVFVAIPGAKVNPLNLITAQLDQGCPIVVYQKNSENDERVSVLQAKYKNTEFVPVTDSVTFLQEFSHHHITEWKNKNPKNTVFAISGSNGKTTHKEMLSHILNTVLPGKVTSTEKNNNNHLGVPLTLFQVSPEMNFVVLELGSNHPGEIKVLCDIAGPNAGLTTNIGATHLEFFGTEKEVFLEEGLLYYAVKQNTNGKGFYLINKDDPFLKTFEKTPGSVPYGESAEAEARISFLENGASITYKGKTLVATNDHITGRHNKLNLITCLFIACHFYPELEAKLIEAAKSFQPTKNRSQWMSFEGKDVFLDAYNANPSSMKAALQGFKESVIAKGKKLTEACVVLGDMYELGDRTPEYHQDLARFVKDLGFSNVYFIGRFSQDYRKGFPEGKASESSAQFKDEYRRECLPKYSIHFIKGSRGIALETLFDLKDGLH
ncbi:MAG: UDP-N-acetylmuramoyl-tripeptide--D-alanyl-D-alanine ligase [Bacteriovoracaceae bacterium]